MTFSLFEWSFQNNTIFMGITTIAAAANAVAATVGIFAGVIAARRWVVRAIIAVIGYL